MSIETATPETGTVGAPASMDDVLSEFDSAGNEGDAVDEAVSKLVEEPQDGDADEAAEAQGDETDAGDEQEQSPAEPEAEPEPTHRVKVNGEEVEVPLSELLKGYSREADYSRKTQALAEERRGLEAKHSAEYADKLKQATDLFVKLDPVLAQADQIDWQMLSREDPTTYVQLRAAYDERVQAVNAARAEIARVEQERQGQETASSQEQGAAEAEALVRAMPELGDPARMASFAQSTVGYLRGVGFGDGEISEVLDHRALVIIDKARRFDAIEKAKASLPARKVVPVSEARPLKADANQSAAPRKRISPNASRDQRVTHVLDQFLED